MERGADHGLVPCADTPRMQELGLGLHVLLWLEESLLDQLQTDQDTMENAHSRSKSADTGAINELTQDMSAMTELRSAMSAETVAESASRRSSRMVPVSASSDSGDDGDTFLASYLRVRRPEWADQYVDFALLMSQIRSMERRLVDIRRRHAPGTGSRPRRSSFRGSRRHRSVGNELEILAESKPIHEHQSTANISPRHNYHRSEGFLPALAAAPEEHEGDDRFSALSPTKRALSLLTGIGGRNRSDSSVSISSSMSGSNAYRGGAEGDWLVPGSEQYQFCALIDSQVEKAVLFYLAEVGRIADELKELTGLADIDTSLNQYKTLGGRLADLCLFVGSNLSAIRKVLTRHDHLIKSDGKALCRYYVRTRRKSKTSHLQSLWFHDGLRAVYGSWRKGYQRALKFDVERLCAIADDDVPQQDLSSMANVDEAAYVKFHNDPCVNCIDATLARIKDATNRSLQELVVLGSVGNTLSLEPTVVANAAIDHKDWDMAFYALTRDGLYGLPGVDMGFLEAGATNGGDFEFGPKETSRGLDYYLPLGLNLFSTFLYMANYFIAGPTSAVYIETLGGHKALAGLVIGCTPWAAMASTLLYSAWTSHNFKHPLLFSGFCLCIGNLLYGLALHFKSIELVLIGRIGVGLGGPRVINRRYIADVSPIAQRTAISATFVTLSAAGTAVGPGLSAICQSIDFKIETSHGTFIFNGLTAPGYIMFVVWLIFSLLIALAFKEPERLGLNELKDKADSPVTTRESSIYDDSEAMGEEKPLLAQSPTAEYGNKEDHIEEITCTISESSTGRSPFMMFCAKNFTVPVWICIVLLFVDKLIMEAIMSSVPVVAGHSYDWSVAEIGSLGVLMGVLVVPLSIAIGAVSRLHEDRVILTSLLAISALGIVLLIDFPELFGEHPDEHDWQYSFFCVGPHKYIYGCLIGFCGLQCLESIIMSMLSKVVPHSLAKGFCNSGLINTETGTFGRAIGDIAVTLAGLATLDKMLNTLMIPLGCVLLFCLIMVRCFYHSLAV